MKVTIEMTKTYQIDTNKINSDYYKSIIESVYDSDGMDSSTYTEAVHEVAVHNRQAILKEKDYIQVTEVHFDDGII